MATMTLTNIKEFQDMLSEMNFKAQKEIMKKGYQNAAKPLIKAAKAGAIGKRVKKSIGSKYYSDSNSIFIGARAGRGFAGFMARWQEQQMKKRRYVTKNNKTHNTGRVIATEFFSNAVEATEKETFDNLYEAFQTGMKKTLTKYSKL